MVKKKATRKKKRTFLEVVEAKLAAGKELTKPEGKFAELLGLTKKKMVKKKPVKRKRAKKKAVKRKKAEKKKPPPALAEDPDLRKARLKGLEEVKGAESTLAVDLAVSKEAYKEAQASASASIKEEEKRWKQAKRRRGEQERRMEQAKELVEVLGRERKEQEERLAHYKERTRVVKKQGIYDIHYGLTLRRGKQEVARNKGELTEFKEALKQERGKKSNCPLCGKLIQRGNLKTHMERHAEQAKTAVGNARETEIEAWNERRDLREAKRKRYIVQGGELEGLERRVEEKKRLKKRLSRPSALSPYQEEHSTKSPEQHMQSLVWNIRSEISREESARHPTVGEQVKAARKRDKEAQVESDKAQEEEEASAVRRHELWLENHLMMTESPPSGYISQYDRVGSEDTHQKRMIQDWRGVKEFISKHPVSVQKRREHVAHTDLNDAKEELRIAKQEGGRHPTPEDQYKRHEAEEAVKKARRAVVLRGKATERVFAQQSSVERKEYSAAYEEKKKLVEEMREDEKKNPVPRSVGFYY